ncbi:MAG: mannose-1-phosphate guanylyltransferase/mannose-6-phosphate isomerase [Methylobacillus sp.]|nr:mannose-1-phosphate guanylyltransferase/mannose-6-phosphate isomerase [Methylobacillus sp.]
MTQPIQPVILCGGSGSRLWPLSRAGFPKQFLCLTSDKSLFQQAAQRLMALGSGTRAPFIVCNEEHRFLASEQLREVGIPLGAALLEPVGRNTAPALTLAALAARESGDDPVLAVIPSDQTMTDDAAFVRAMQIAIAQADQGRIAILGIAPDRPETGYGYIKTGAGSDVLPVERFVEKPDVATARNYLDEGGYFWNAGMFVMKASVWLQALEFFRSDIADTVCAAWEKRSTDASFLRPGKAEFMAIPGESIDYAVMERCPQSPFPIVMVPLDAGWNDLGAWDAVWNVLPKDADGNACFGDVLMTGSRNNLAHATSRLVSLVGVENLVVIETSDAVLVAEKSRSQEIKNIVAMLNQQQREEHALHRKVHRPWGWYDSIDTGDHFKVKRIQVNPKSSLSLQKHLHRAEHWVVVKGVAEVICSDKTIRLVENQSTYIPLGEVHRLTNPGTTPLEIIEVQSGDYLGEDDIIRFEDRYGRSGENASPDSQTTNHHENQP